MKDLVQKVRLELEQFNYEYTWWNDHLQGACLIGSFLLHQELLKVGIKSTICENVNNKFGHVWLETETHLIDITYSQFDYDADERVLILEKSPLNEFNYPLNKNVIRHEVITEESFSSWTPAQRPWYYLNQKKRLTALTRKPK